MKTCKKCEQSLPTSAFRVVKKKYLDSYCRSCSSELQKPRRAAWTKSNPERNHGYNILARFGITSDEYNLLLEQQGHKCAICKVPAQELDRRLAVDHDHTTGVVRGLLCTKCNLGIGYLQDNVEVISAAVDYLQTKGKTNVTVESA